MSQEKRRQQGEHECVNRDVLVAFGKWEFDPIELSNPFSENNKGCVQMWQSSEDRVVPIELNHFIAKKLPWIQYYTIPNAGHMVIHDDQSFEIIIRELLAG